MTTIDEAKKMLDVQGQSGNWNYDPYMHGMYNGMEYVIAMMEDREPTFKKAPETWLADLPMPEQVVAAEETKEKA